MSWSGNKAGWRSWRPNRNAGRRLSNAENHTESFRGRCHEVFRCSIGQVRLLRVGGWGLAWKRRGTLRVAGGCKPGPVRRVGDESTAREHQGTADTEDERYAHRNQA